MPTPLEGDVVVVDDERDVAEMLTMTLQVQGFVVRTFSNGEEALASILESPPAIVLLDVMMPGLDGMAVLRTLKSDDATKHIPVIMLTAKVADQDVWDGWSAGADYYLSKPFDPDELHRYLRTFATPEEGAETS